MTTATTPLTTVAIEAVTLEVTAIARAAAIFAEAEGYELDSDFMHLAACEDLKGIKALQQKIDATRKGYTKPLDEQKKVIMDFYRPAEQYLVQAESVLKKKIARYIDVQNAQRAAAQLAAARATDAVKAQLEGEAKVAQEAGNHNQAAGLQMAAAITTVATPIMTPLKASGISSRKTFKGTICNQAQLIAHIMANPTLVAMGIITIDQAALNKYIQATKGEVQLPGVLIETGTTIASRAA